MTKYTCPDCGGTFDAPTDTETARCPGCGEMAAQQSAPGTSRAYPDCERCGDTGCDPEGANQPCADCQQSTDQTQFGVDDCTCIPFTRQTDPPRILNRPTDTVDMISGWERGGDCPHHAPAAAGVAPAADQTERRERYAAAVQRCAEEGNVRYERIAEAVMAVADAGHAQARESWKASLRRADKLNNQLMEEVQRYAAGTERPVLWSVYNAMHLRAAAAENVIERVVALADRWENALAPDQAYARSLRAALDVAEPPAAPPAADRAAVLAEELAGARATIDHMTKAMSWICGHDRQGLDHLEEAQYEGRARMAAVEQARRWAARARAAEHTQSVLPDTSRADVLVEAADALAAERQVHSAPGPNVHRRSPLRVQGMADAETLLRRMADEAQQQPCAECGHPKAVHSEGEDPVTPGMCSACPDDDAYHDYDPAGEEQQPAAEAPRPTLRERHRAAWNCLSPVERNARLAELDADDGQDEAQQQPDTETLAAIFEGFGRILATSSRDWSEYAPDAWLYAVILGWDCEKTKHNETCTHGAMEEMQQRHGWSDEAVAKARRYRAAVRALTDPATVQQPVVAGTEQEPAG